MDRHDEPRPRPNDVDELLRHLLEDGDEHLSYEQLEELVDGRLTSDTLAAVQLHLSACESCRANEVHLRSIAAQLKGEGRPQPEEVSSARESEPSRIAAFPSRPVPGTVRPARRSWWVAAAGVAAALALVVWTVSRTSDPSVEGPSVALTAPAAIPLLPLDKPDVRLGASAIAWRGGGSENAYLADLKAPLDAYRGGDYGEADRRFTELGPRYPSSFEIRFYQGVSRLFLGDARGASAALAEAERIAAMSVAPDSALFLDIVWYRAVADQRADDPDAAARQLTRLCATPGARQAPSCEALALFKDARQ